MNKEIWNVKDEITDGEYNYTLEDFVKAGVGEKIPTSDPNFYVKSMQRAMDELARLRKDSKDLKEAISKKQFCFYLKSII